MLEVNASDVDGRVLEMNIVPCKLMYWQLLSQQAVCKTPLPLNPSCSYDRRGQGALNWT